MQQMLQIKAMPIHGD